MVANAGSFLVLFLGGLFLLLFDRWAENLYSTRYAIVLLISTAKTACIKDIDAHNKELLKENKKDKGETKHKRKKYKERASCKLM